MIALVQRKRLAVVVFLFFAVLIALWWSPYFRGRRACRHWFTTGEPALTGVTLEIDGVTISSTDEVELTYWNDCFANHCPWSSPPDDARRIESEGAREEECDVWLHFENGATYYCWGGSRITVVSLSLCIPGERQDEFDWETTFAPFQYPMPDTLQAKISRLLGCECRFEKRVPEEPTDADESESIRRQASADSP